MRVELFRLPRIFNLTGKPLHQEPFEANSHYSRGVSLGFQTGSSCSVRALLRLAFCNVPLIQEYSTYHACKSLCRLNYPKCRSTACCDPCPAPAARVSQAKATQDGLRENRTEEFMFRSLQSYPLSHTRFQGLWLASHLQLLPRKLHPVDANDFVGTLKQVSPLSRLSSQGF